MELSRSTVASNKHNSKSSRRAPKALTEGASRSSSKRDMADPILAWTERGIYRDCSHLPALTSVHSRKDHPLWQSNATKEPKFPVKLHMMLSNPELEDVIAWLPHGRSFRILNIQKLEQYAIPRYFRHGNYSSFSRQINGWGFKRSMHGPNYQSYYHPLFLRGLPHLCERLKRLSSKHDQKADKIHAEQATPDLALFTKKFPLPQATPLASPEGAIHLPPVFAKQQAKQDSGHTSPKALQADIAKGASSADGEEAALWKELQALEQRKQEILSKRKRREQAKQSATEGPAVSTARISLGTIHDDVARAATSLPGMTSSQLAESRLGESLGAIPTRAVATVADLLLLQALQTNQAYAAHGLSPLSLLMSSPKNLSTSSSTTSPVTAAVAASLSQQAAPSRGNVVGIQLQEIFPLLAARK